MSEQVNDSGAKKRPVFITVLAILTFVGAGFGVISGLGQLSIDGGLGGSTIIANLLCIVGAIMMMKLKKVGFYLYVVGQLTPIIYVFAVLGGLEAMSVPGLGSAVAAVTAIVLIVPIAFIVMYALNLKHMK